MGSRTGPKASVITNNGPAGTDFAELLRHLGEEIIFIKIESRTGAALTLAFKSTPGNPSGLRFRLRNEDRTEICTQRVTSEPKILKVLKEFYETARPSDAFHWQLTRGFFFDHEPQLERVPPKQQTALLPPISSKSPFSTFAGCMGVLIILGGSLWLLDYLAKDFLFPKKKPSETQTSASSVRIAATDLYTQYSKNEITADRNYKDQVVEVEGKIKDIGRDLKNEPFVCLDAGESAWPFTVQCFFPKLREFELTLLSKGQTVTIQGKCTGKFGNVFIKESRTAN